MKKKKHYIKIEYIIALCLAALTAVLSISVSLAAYTNQGYKKGVVTTSTSEVRFSSNFLKLYAENSDADQRENATLSMAGRRSIPVQVNNYPNGNPGQYNTNVIIYKITFTIESMDPEFTINAADYSVSGCTLEETGNGDVVFSTTGTLLGTRTQSDVYTVEISDEAVGKIRIIAAATPTGTAAKAAVNYNMLYRVIIPVESGSGAETTFDWQGLFFDAGTGVPADYHAFNYEVTGTVGKGTATLTWDYNKVTIDPYFLTDMNLTETVSGTTRSVTFPVDATIVKDYVIPFYRTAAADGETWAEMNSVITFSAEEGT